MMQKLIGIDERYDIVEETALFLGLEPHSTNNYSIIPRTSIRGLCFTLCADSPKRTII